MFLIFFCVFHLSLTLFRFEDEDVQPLTPFDQEPGLLNSEILDLRVTVLSPIIPRAMHQKKQSQVLLKPNLGYSYQWVIHEDSFGAGVHFFATSALCGYTYNSQATVRTAVFGLLQISGQRRLNAL